MYLQYFVVRIRNLPFCDIWSSFSSSNTKTIHQILPSLCCLPTI